MAGISWISGHASAQPARVLTGGTWCCWRNGCGELSAAPCAIATPRA